jgi:regulator of sigma E protease
MGTFLWNTSFFLIALGILVAVHEFGHFWVARRCGVKVARFSIGFGKTIWSRMGKDGTEYVLALIPLGGYVKMLDERVEAVSAKDRQFAFNNKSLVQRSAIVAAGPVANFILAILAFWMMFMVGVPSVRAVLGDIEPGSPAALAGLDAGFEIVSIEGDATPDWESVNLTLVKHLGQPQVTLKARQSMSEAPQSYMLDAHNWEVNREMPSPLEGLGLKPFSPKAHLQVAQVVENSAAMAAGLAVNDKLLSLNGEKLQNWHQFVELIQSHPRQLIRLEVERSGQSIELPVTPDGREVDGVLQGYVGVAPVVDSLPAAYQFTQQYGLIGGFVKSLDRSWELSKLTVVMLGKLVTGSVSLDNLSGPISIAKGAGATAEYGLVYFLGFLALISINLGIINLFPLPVLDGGHLVFFAIEGLTGKPVSERIQAVGFRIGAALLMTLMLLAIFNDVMRLQ